MQQRKVTIGRVLTASVSAVVVAGMLGGCRASDALKEIVYLQTADTVDYDNPNKYYINDSSAKEKSDKVSAKETSKKSSNATETQNIVVYSSEAEDSDYTAKKQVFSINPDFNGLEASEGVRFYESTKKNAVKRPAQDKTEKTKKKSQKTPTEGGSGDSKGKGDAAGKTNSKKKKSEKTPTGGSRGTKVKVNDTTGAFSEPPKVNRIAAYGDAAVIVQMVGGQGALVAADKTLLSSKFTTVFGDEGASKIAKGWSDDGSASKINVDAIIKAKADTVLCFDSDYQKDMSDADRKKLKKAGISFTVIPALTNTTYIKTAVTKVGEMLSEANEIGQAGNTEKIASDYEKFVDKLISKCVSANGGTLAGKKTYENKNEEDYSYDEDAPFTLLIDDWDSNARFSRKYRGASVTSTSGVALSTIGWKSTPVSYYIQAGGLINNAAYKSTSTSAGKMVVWQYNTYQLSIEKSSWSVAPKNVAAASLNVANWDFTLLTTARNQAGNKVGSSFGTSDFPVVIAGTNAIKKNFVASARKSGSLYYPYSMVKDELMDTFGLKANGKDVLWSSVGVDGSKATENVFSSSSDVADAVLVNPHGLFSSWLTGSVESVLEAAWVSDVANGSGAAVDYESYIEEFYKDFYRYDEMSSSDVSTIVGGE